MQDSNPAPCFPEFQGFPQLFNSGVPREPLNKAKFYFLLPLWSEAQWEFGAGAFADVPLVFIKSLGNPCALQSCAGISSQVVLMLEFHWDSEGLRFLCFGLVLGEKGVTGGAQGLCPNPQLRAPILL